MAGSNTDDRIAIRDTIDRFSMAVTLRDSAALGALFTDKSEWRVGPPVNMAFDGAAEIGTGVVASLGRFEYLVQMVHSVVIDLDGDRARAQSLLEEVGRDAGGGSGVRVYGIYHDDLIRTGAGWRFERRMFMPIDFDLAAPGGNCVGTGKLAPA